MKSIWWILSLLLGILVFAKGCMSGNDMFQYAGAFLIFVGIVLIDMKIQEIQEKKETKQVTGR